MVNEKTCPCDICVGVQENPNNANFIGVENCDLSLSSTIF